MPNARSWKDALDLHRAERRGFILLSLACLLAAAWVTWEEWLRPEDPATLRQVSAEVGAWTRDTPRRTAPGADTDAASPAAQLFPFDPNDLPLEQWVALGLSERQAGALHRYEAAGGRFRTKRDLGRMRVVDPELFARWAPYIQLPDSLEPRQAWPERALGAGPDAGERAMRTAGGARTVELNSADSAALVAVPGIGPAFARGLIKYRDKLGGYRSLDQLAEVYVLRDKPDAVARIRERLVIDTLLVRHLPVNTVTVEELAAHPYGGWQVAKALVAYRKQHGPFRSVGDIRGCALVSDSVFRKLAPYLSAP